MLLFECRSKGIGSPSRQFTYEIPSDKDRTRTNAAEWTPLRAVLFAGKRSEGDGCHPAMVCSLTRVRTTAGYPGVVVGGGDQAVFAGITALGLQPRVTIKRAMAVIL
jgi:hypothetical protein